MNKENLAREVHSYYTSQVNIADAKVSILLAANLVVFTSSVNWSVPKYFIFIHYLTLIFLVLSILLCCFCLFPRLTKPVRGFIFWRSVRDFGRLEKYKKGFIDLTEREILEEYLKQNWALSGILCQKYKWIRYAITSFSAAVFCGGLLLLLNIRYP